MRGMGRDLLAKYLASSGVSQRELERRIGAKPGLICRYLNGSRSPGGRIAFNLERATAGSVPASTWWAPPRRRPAA